MKKKAIPQETRRSVALRYGCQPGVTLMDAPCYWCGVPGRIVWFRRADGTPSGWVSFDHELDHLLPEFHGGTGEPSNIVLACRRCNRSRGHTHDILSEVGVSRSPVDHDSLTLGREGKGREQGGEGITTS